MNDPSLPVIEMKSDIRWMLGPIGWPTGALALLTVCWMFWLATSPGFYYSILHVVVPIMFFLPFLVMRIAWDALRIRVSRVFRQPPARFELFTRRGAVILLMFGICYGMIQFRIPLRIGFSLNRNALDQLADRIKDIPPAAPPAELLIYHLSVAPRSNDEYVYLRDANSQSGFVRTKSSNLPPIRGAAIDHWGHLSGNWYWVVEE